MVRRDATRRGTVRYGAALRAESTFTAILDIQRFFSRVHVEEREVVRHAMQIIWQINFSYLIKRIEIPLGYINTCVFVINITVE